MSKDKSGHKDKCSKKSKNARKKDDSYSPEELAQIHYPGDALQADGPLSRSFAESGLYAGQDGVILALAPEGSITPGQIAQSLGVKGTHHDAHHRRMEAQGFVERSGD